MVSAKTPLVCGNKIGHQFNGALEVTRVDERNGEIMPGPEGMGMVRPQYALCIKQKFGEQPYGVFGVAYLVDVVSMLEARFQGIEMIWPQRACQVGNERG